MGRIYNLNSSPFAHFSAEEELEFIDQIYYEPRYYSELLELLSSGVSRFIIGKRGQGKSATIHKLFNDLSKNHTLPLLITRYDDIPLVNNKNHLLYRIMQSMTIGIAKHLVEEKDSKKLLSKKQQNKLSFFIELFYEENCSNEFIESAKVIRGIKSRNKWYKFYNRNVLGLLNTIINGGVSVTGEIIRQLIGLEPGQNDIVFKEYVKEVPTKEIKSYSIQEVASWSTNNLLKMLTFLIEVSKSLGYQSIVVLFDQIDEFSKINADVEKVTDFTIEILSDTDLLYSDKLSIVFSLWSEVKRSLNRQGIRFDKFRDIDTTWRPEELENLINLRLKYFSIDKNSPVSLSSLIPNDNDRKKSLELADNSPRALIRLLGEIYSEVYNESELSSFKPEAISKGFEKFCTDFDYESQNPSKLGKRNDLIHWINRVLRIRKITFTIEDLNMALNQKSPTSIKHIDEMMKLNIIKELYEKTDTEETLYEVIDPKIKHLISRGILDLGK
jgi:hypothetical protein